MVDPLKVDVSVESAQAKAMRDKLAKMKARFPEDPDNIRAKSELKKRADDEMRRMFMMRQHATKSNIEVLKNARAVRNQKPKTKEG